jgi:putative transposase
MPNHVHLVLQVARGEDLSRAMLKLNLTYALYYHKRHRYSGHLWQGRFKSLPIDRDSYLLECGRYVELNPVRAGLCHEPSGFPWTSYRAYSAGAEDPVVRASGHPLYQALGLTMLERQTRYVEFIRDGMRESGRLMAPDSHSPSRLGQDGGIKALLGVSPRPGRPRKLAATTNEK